MPIFIPRSTLEMSLSLPKELRKGQKLSADWLNQLLRYVGGITLRSSPGVLVSISPNGTTITITAKGRGGGSSENHPFRVINASTESAAKVSVVYGQVKNITPTMGGTPLSSSAPPTMAVVSGTVYLDVTVDSSTGLPTSVAVGNAAATPADTSTHAYLTLAAVTVVGSAVTAINQSVTHSLGFQRCGSGTLYNFWGI